MAKKNKKPNFESGEWSYEAYSPEHLEYVKWQISKLPPLDSSVKRVFLSYVDAINIIIDKAIPDEPNPPVLESEYIVSPTLEEIDEYRENLVLYNQLLEEYKGTASFRDSLEELRTQTISEVIKNELGFYSRIPEKYQKNIWDLIVTSSGYRWGDLYDAAQLQVSIFSSIDEI
jgi:hypothetical protein